MDNYNIDLLSDIYEKRKIKIKKYNQNTRNVSNQSIYYYLLVLVCCMPLNSIVFLLHS